MKAAGNATPSTQPGEPMNIKRLQLFLRAFSLVPMSAAFAAMLPVGAMDQVHQYIGLGSLPRGPIVEYLARSTSMFYAMHGVLLWYIASDLRRYRDLFRLYLWLSMLFALGLFLTDISAGLPPEWAMAEGPMIAAFVGVIMWLFRVSETRSASAQPPTP
jgi:hypothetical protein